MLPEQVNIERFRLPFVGQLNGYMTKARMDFHNRCLGFIALCRSIFNRYIHGLKN